MTDEPDNVIDFGKARLRKQASKPSKAAKVEPPAPEAMREPMSHEDICEWIKDYMGEPDGTVDPEGESSTEAGEHVEH